MIAGETEAMIKGRESLDNYYNFLGFGKKSAKEEEKKEVKFWARLGGFLKDQGGVEGIANAASSVAGIVKKKDKQGKKSDFSLDLGDGSSEKSPSIPMGVYIIGGLAVVGIIVAIAGNLAKKKQQILQSA